MAKLSAHKTITRSRSHTSLNVVRVTNYAERRRSTCLPTALTSRYRLFLNSSSSQPGDGRHAAVSVSGTPYRGWCAQITALLVAVAACLPPGQHVLAMFPAGRLHSLPSATTAALWSSSRSRAVPGVPVVNSKSGDRRYPAVAGGGARYHRRRTHVTLVVVDVAVRLAPRKNALPGNVARRLNSPPVCATADVGPLVRLNHVFGAAEDQVSWTAEDAKLCVGPSLAVVTLRRSVAAVRWRWSGLVGDDELGGERAGVERPLAVGSLRQSAAAGRWRWSPVVRDDQLRPAGGRRSRLASFWIGDRRRVRHSVAGDRIAVVRVGQSGAVGRGFQLARTVRHDDAVSKRRAVAGTGQRIAWWIVRLRKRLSRPRRRQIVTGNQRREMFVHNVLYWITRNDVVQFRLSSSVFFDQNYAKLTFWTICTWRTVSSSAGWAFRISCLYVCLFVSVCMSGW